MQVDHARSYDASAVGMGHRDNWTDTVKTQHDNYSSTTF